MSFRPDFYTLEAVEKRCYSSPINPIEEDDDYTSYLTVHKKEVETINMVRNVIGNDRIDFKNEKHQKLLYIAENVDRIQHLTQEEAQIAIAMKGDRSLAYQKLAQDAAPIVKVVDRGVELLATSGILGPWGNMALLVQKWCVEAVFKPPASVNSDDLLRGYPQGIPMKKAQEIAKYPLSEDGNRLMMSEFSRELQTQGDIVDGMVESLKPEKSYSEIAKKFTNGLTQMVMTFNSLEAANQQYREERHQLREGFDRVCRDFGWNYNLDTFRHQNATQIAEFFDNSGTHQSIADRARLMHQLSDSVSQSVHGLQNEIQGCIDNNQTYEQQRSQLINHTNKLNSVYKDKLKNLEKMSSGFRIIQAAASLCEDLPGGKQVATAAGCVAGHIDNKRRRRLERYKESMGKSEEGIRRIGMLGSQSIAKLTALQENERAEQNHLIAMRKKIDPVVYMDLMTDLSRGFGQQKEMLNQEMSKTQSQLQKLERQKKQLLNSSERERQRDLSLIDTQITDCQKKLKEGEASVGKLDQMLEQNQTERALAEYVSPLSKLRAAILKEQEGTLPDEKTLKWQLEFEELIQLQAELRKESSILRQQVLGGLAPLINNLQIFAEKCMGYNGNFFRGLNCSLKIASDCNAIFNDVSTIKEFAQTAITENGKAPIPWKTLIPGLIIPLSSTLSSMLSIMIAIHNFRNPEKDPIIEALEKQGEALVNVQKEFYQQQLRALNEHYNDLSKEIKDGVKKVIMKIDEGNAAILNRLEKLHVSDYQSRITDIRNKIRLENNFKQLCIYLQQAREKEQNGILEGDETSYMVEQPSLYIGALFRTHMESEDLPPNLILFKAILEKAVELSKEPLSSAETANLQTFVRDARNGIKALNILTEFPQKALGRTLESLNALRTYVQGQCSSSEPQLSPCVPSSQKFLLEPRLGAKKFVPEYWGNKNHASTYDDRVREMFQDHYEQLAKQTAGITIPSSDESLAPLIFPRKYLDSIEKELSSMRTKLSYLNAGKLTLSNYNFKNVKERMELRLQWSVVIDEEGERPRPFIEAAVATFDTLTVAPFQQNLNEFLIQSMYGGKHGLGLPGKGTTQENGKLFTVERMFPGLFVLFYHRQENEPLSFVYNSEMNRERALQTADNLQQSANINPFNGWWQKVAFNSDAPCFFAIEATIKRKQNTLFENVKYQAYRKNYYALQAFFRLQTGASKEDLQREMEHHFGLLPLDHPDFLQTEPESLPLTSRVWNFYQAFGGCPNLLQELNKFEGDLRQL